VGKSYCIQVEIVQQPDDSILPVDFDNYVGTKRYVSVKNLNLKPGASVEDLEIDSIQDCNIKNKKVLYNLKCKILNKQPELVIEGIVKELSLNTKDHKKRLLSSHSSNLVSQNPKRMNTASETETNINPSQSNSHEFIETTSQTQLEFSSQEIGSSSNELTIDKIIKLANKNQFPKKLITIANEEHYYTATLNFFEFVDKYTKIPEENVEFKCKICNNTFHAVIGKTRNLNKHLKTHENLDEWHQKYSSSNKRGEEKIIDDKTLTLVKYFISSNAALKELKNKWLRELISVQILPGPHSFRTTILPQVYQKLRDEIEKRLKKASTVCLLTDLWCNTQTTDFIGLCGVLTSHSFEREILVIDMIRMPSKRHTAENIKFAIEQMVKIKTTLFFLIRIVYLR